MILLLLAWINQIRKKRTSILIIMWMSGFGNIVQFLTNFILFLAIRALQNRQNQVERGRSYVNDYY